MYTITNHPLITSGPDILLLLINIELTRQDNNDPVLATKGEFISLVRFFSCDGKTSPCANCFKTVETGLTRSLRRLPRTCWKESTPMRELMAGKAAML